MTETIFWFDDTDLEHYMVGRTIKDVYDTTILLDDGTTIRFLEHDKQGRKVDVVISHFDDTFTGPIVEVTDMGTLFDKAFEDKYETTYQEYYIHIEHSTALGILFCASCDADTYPSLGMEIDY